MKNIKYGKDELMKLFNYVVQSLKNHKVDEATKDKYTKLNELLDMQIEDINSSATEQNATRYEIKKIELKQDSVSLIRKRMQKVMTLIQYLYKNGYENESIIYDLYQGLLTNLKDECFKDLKNNLDLLKQKKFISENSNKEELTKKANRIAIVVDALLTYFKKNDKKEDEQYFISILEEMSVEILIKEQADDLLFFVCNLTEFINPSKYEELLLNVRDDIIRDEHVSKISDKSFKAIIDGGKSRR